MMWTRHLLVFILFVVAFDVQAQIQSSCARDIRRHCASAGNDERDLVFCLKRNSNELQSPCFSYIRQYLEIHYPPTPRPTPTIVPTPTPIPTPTPTPEIPKLVRWNVDPARYQDCINRWPSMTRGYFVLDKEEVCSQYAKVYPTEAISKCVSDSLGARPHTRDYFLNFQSMAEFCESNPNMDAAHRTCILQKVQNGGEVVSAYNKCDPKIKNCIARMEHDHPSYGQQSYSNLYYEFCFSYPDDPEMSKCVSDAAHSYPGLITNQATLQNLCHPKARSCATRLRKLLPKKQTVDQLVDVGYTCHKAFQEELTEDWAECTFGYRLSLKMDLSKAGDLCKMTNVNARECVAEYIKSKISYDDSIKICRVQSKDVRECLVKSFKGQAPFDSAPMKGTSFDVADKYCTLETAAEKSCFVSALSNEHTQDEATVNRLASTCHEQGEPYRKCIADYNEYFEHNYVTNVTRAEGKKICAIPSQEMRLCMLNSIMRRQYVKPKSFFSEGNTWFPYDKYYDICLGEFLGRLLKELSTGSEWPCRYQFFDQMSVWDKGWHCALVTERYCQDFRQMISTMTDAELAPHCRGFNPHYHTAENTYGNPLWHQCLSRHLIH